ncbi:autotransporter outer membrane beta-barrel domain-containing protein [Enterobacteriaceae bacterium 89]|nr:autotransporter outer membrane beta-barrel domain-containing protein [Enterobacteriaceae bacterium 89]
MNIKMSPLALVISTILSVSSLSAFAGKPSQNTGNIAADETVTDIVLNSGDREQSVYGHAINTEINSGASQYVYYGGSATNTVINEGGSQSVYGSLGREATTITGTTINGGTQTIRSYSEGTTNPIPNEGLVIKIDDTTINNGGVQNITLTAWDGAGAYLDQRIEVKNTRINDGVQNVTLLMDPRLGGNATLHALATGTTINNGGVQNLYINEDWYLVDKNFIVEANNTVINTGGTQIIGVHTLATSTTINGGVQNVFGTTTDTTINSGQSWLYTGALADGKTEINVAGEMLMEAGSHATDITINGGTLSMTDLTDTTSSHIPAQVDKLAMDGGSVSFLRDSEGDYAALNIGELSGSGNFLFNSSLAERNANFVTIENGTGNFGIAVNDSGREIADHTDLTVNLVHDQQGEIDFSMVTAKGRSTGAIDGGTYMYTLHSQQDKDGLNGGNVWYLGAMTDEGNGGDGNEGGGNEGGGNGGGGGSLVTTPSTDAILSMATAGLNIIRGEMDARRVYRTNQADSRKHGEGNVWGHYLGKKSAVDTSSGAAYKLYQNGFELGGDFTTGFARGDLVTGGYMTLSGNNVSHDRGGKSKVDSYGLGAYATWYDNSGFYLDSVLKTNRLESKLNARMTNGDMTSGSWHQYSVSTAVEGGFTFKLTEDLRVEPFARVAGTHINNANVKLSNGMKAQTGKARSLTAEAGTRVGTQFAFGTTQFAPYLSASVEQEFVKSNEAHINGVNRFDNNLNGTSGKYGAGMSVALAPQAALYGEVNYRQGSYVEEPVQGVVGIRIGF